MWVNNDMQGVAREMNDAIDDIQRQSANTSHKTDEVFELHRWQSAKTNHKTDKVFVLHRFSGDRVPDFGPHGHHHQTIQDPHRYRQMKIAKNRKRNKAEKAARKRNRR